MKNLLFASLFSLTSVLFSSNVLFAQNGDTGPISFSCSPRGSNQSFPITLNPDGFCTVNGVPFGVWSKRDGVAGLDDYDCEYRCDPFFPNGEGTYFITVNFIGYGTYNHITPNVANITSGFVAPKK